MADFTRLNLVDDVEDMAPKFGFAPQLQSRFARKPLSTEKSGLGFFRVQPGFRVPFGHRHGEQEEVYVVVNGSARFKLDGEVVELRQWDAIRVPGSTTRAFEGGPDGADILVFGAPNNDNADTEMLPGWWSD